MNARVPEIRVRRLNDLPIRQDGKWIIYWMIMQRRTRYNFSLQRAVEWSMQLGKPLLILEALRCGYEWASDRIHRFVLHGMRDNRRACDDTGIQYFPYVEPEAGAGSGLLQALAEEACVIVTDDFPCFFLPRMLQRTASRLPLLLEAVDGNGLLPMRAADQVYPTAYAFRRFLQRQLPVHLQTVPLESAWAGRELPPPGSIPQHILQRWPMATDDWLDASPGIMANLPIDHQVTAAAMDGGMRAAGAMLRTFLDRKLDRYDTDRSEPDEDAASGLSPYLHFGHIAAHEVFQAIAEREQWDLARIQSRSANGKRSGWWQMTAPAESFLDELVTWRELGYNFCWQRQDDYDRYSSLPDWARATLEQHQGDVRDPCYSPAELENADTHDPLWNAAQTQLVREGRLHNYLRMLWGKKILEWSPTPQDAIQVMIHLNNKYAVDGRNPNSYSGIFWCCGRYDRPWGPERRIFGKVRYMSSENTARKLRVREYLARYGCERNLF